jgi:hypothetical protein
MIIYGQQTLRYPFFWLQVEFWLHRISGGKKFPNSGAEAGQLNALEWPRGIHLQTLTDPGNNLSCGFWIRQESRKPVHCKTDALFFPGCTGTGRQRMNGYRILK